MEINNNLIAVLLILSIGISVFGIAQMVTVMREGITGAATGTGVTNLTVGGATGIRLIRNVTDFGSGSPQTGQLLYIATDADNSQGFDDGTEGNGSANSYGDCATNYPSEDHCAFPFVVENTGNTNPQLNITAANSSTEFILCEGSCAQTPEFKFKGVENETGACISGLQSTYTDVPKSPTESVICDSFNTSTNGDEIRIHFQIGIPDNARQQTFKNTITIEAL